MPPLELIAHRGYTLRYPENTLAALRGAVDGGARHVEFDVQLSSDRVPFLFHDRSLDRLCEVPGRLEEHTAAQIRELRAHEPWRFGRAFADEPVASLAAAVELLAESPGVGVFVELKRSSIEAFGRDAVLDEVLPALQSLAGRCTLISFDYEVLARARRREAPPVGPVLVAWQDRESPAVRELEPVVVFVDLDKLPADGPIRPPAGELAVYEVDDAAQARSLAERGARFVETFAIVELMRALEKPA